MKLNENCTCRYTADEYFMEDSDSDESEGEAVSDEDPDWQKTPLFKRIKKLKGPSLYDGHEFFCYLFLTPSQLPLCPNSSQIFLCKNQSNVCHEN